MQIEIRTVEMDPENEKVEVHFETEDGHRFNKVIKIDEETDTKEKLRKHIESMAPDIATEFVYDGVTFDFQTNAFFYESPEGEETDQKTTFTEEELDDMNKDKLLDAANKAGVYTDDMEKRSFTKTGIIEKILEAQEPEE